MTYAVSSWFVDQTMKKEPVVLRRFMIGASDYSGKVIKWPTIKRKWNDIRPISADIILENASQEMNLFQADKTLLTSSCTLEMGFPHNVLTDASSMARFGTGLIYKEYNYGISPRGLKEAAMFVDSNTGTTAYAWKDYYVNSGFEPALEHTASMFVKKDNFNDDTFCAMVVNVYGGVATGEIAHLYWGNATGVNSIDDIALMTANGGVEDMGDYWRPWITFKTLSSSHGLARTRIYPTHGSLLGVPNVLSVGSIEVSMPQMSVGGLQPWTDSTSDSDSYIQTFAGTPRKVSYGKGSCKLTLVDRMKTLSERLVGTSDVPIDYTGSDYLISDLAWWAVTSHGGFSAVQSTSNPDINYTQFSEWAAVMSGDSVIAQALYKGIKVTEILRKIGRMSQSAIYMEEDKLVFSRFSVVGDPDITLDYSTMIANTLSIQNDDIVNKQFVYADYDVTSDYFKITVNDVDSASVNSYGVHERIEKDASLWYANSASALNLAQRSTYTNGEPQDVIDYKSPLVTLTKQIGDTVTYVDSLTSVGESYRIMQHTLDMNKCSLKSIIDRTQIVNPFFLDITSLDGTEVLT